MERRTFLAATGVSLLGTATGLPSPVAASPAPEAAVREYYERAERISDFRAFAEAVDELSHSASPLPELAEGQPSFQSRARRREVDETAVVAENVDIERFTDRSSLLRASLGEAETRDIAEENAVVSVSFRSATPDVEWLVATEDGEWRLVYFLVTRSSGPGSVVREYYRRASDESVSDFRAFAAEAAALSHGVSPLPEVLEAGPSQYSEAREANVVETRILAEDIDPRRVTAESEYLRASLSEADVEALEGENAVVETTLENGGDELVLQWFLATEDGEWRLVWVADTTTPESVVRGYYRRAASAADRAAFADSLEAITHSASLLTDAVNQSVVGESIYSSARRATLLETEVLERNIGAERIADEYLGSTDRTDPEVQSVTSENAVVEATVEYEAFDGEYGQEWLVATEDGEWRLVWF